MRCFSKRSSQQGEGIVGEDRKAYNAQGVQGDQPIYVLNLSYMSVITRSVDVPMTWMPARRRAKNVSLPLCLWYRSPILLTGMLTQVVERRCISLSLVKRSQKSVFNNALSQMLDAQPIGMSRTSRSRALVKVIGTSPSSGNTTATVMRTIVQSLPTN